MGLGAFNDFQNALLWAEPCCFDNQLRLLWLAQLDFSRAKSLQSYFLGSKLLRPQAFLMYLGGRLEVLIFNIHPSVLIGFLLTNLPLHCISQH
jgi:hypothetical protein